ncbi:osmotin-like protein OSML81 [Nicotiana tabacum]|uniref:Osmotin-like protein OSML81 n=2 Tax=Nicotiana TaxID=4085 RepID=A0A1S3ZKK3_TOBAC|nr:PREDICTED: osmotin-like protein OSML81 [Nicotiana sylvestris]XP_016464887.1 PREDICTED: osmotin-like protein OSML81 [Nicotiana tabacum]
MGYLTTFVVFSLLAILTFAYADEHTTDIEIRNNCPYTVWAAAADIGGGRRLDQGQTWTIREPPHAIGRIWGRTDCTFDSSGKGSCQTGDCDGVLNCTGWGKKPNTLIRFALDNRNDLDLFYISLEDGFNIPISFTPTVVTSGGKCHAISCTANINSECPDDLKVTGGCNNPCDVYKTPDGRCNTYSTEKYFKFFKEKCPEAHSSPDEDSSEFMFDCPSGKTNYKIAFCPLGNAHQNFPLKMTATTHEVAK